MPAAANNIGLLAEMEVIVKNKHSSSVADAVVSLAKLCAISATVLGIAWLAFCLAFTAITGSTDGLEPVGVVFVDLIKWVFTDPVRDLASTVGGR